MENRKNLKNLLNDSTPYAPTEDEAKERIAANLSKASVQSPSRSENDPLGGEVFVPIKPMAQNGEVVVAYEFRQRDGEPPYLPVFTTDEILARELGAIQTRMKIRLPRLLELIDAQYIEIDPQIGREDWRWTEEEASEYAERLRKALARNE